MEKECTKCNSIKSFDLFYKNKSKKDGVASTCIECCKEYRENNNVKYRYKDKYKDKYKDRYYNTKEWRNEYHRKYFQEKGKEKRKERLKKDKLFKLKRLLSYRTYSIFLRKNFFKSNVTIDLIGTDILSVKQYLEDKFTDGMNWENQGKWHIDHIIPLSSANTEEELIKLCHYTNLQPLWAADNLKKSNKILT